MIFLWKFFGLIFLIFLETGACFSQKAFFNTFSNSSPLPISNKERIKPKLIISGAPASGKGTQCDVLLKRFGLVHLSTGDILRDAVQMNTDLGKSVSMYLETGRLVPDNIMIELVTNRILFEDSQNRGWILDGFPRTLIQAQSFISAKIDPHCFLFLDVSEKTVIKRAVGRRIDPTTGQIYHLTFSPPNKEVTPRLIQRNDDRESVVRSRYREFRNNIESIKPCFRDIWTTIDAERNQTEVTSSILSHLTGTTSSAVGFASTFSVTRCLSSSRSRSKYPHTNLKGKVVMITGATSGIGEACAWKFAKHDAKLVLIGRRNENLQKIKSSIQSEYPSVAIHTIAMSVTETEKVQALPTQLPHEFSNVYALINNAGLALGVTTVDKNSMEDTKTMLDTNVLGLISFCTAFIPGMVGRNEGHIINMGSVAGLHAYTTGSVYCATKFAVDAYTKAARHDLAGTPLRVTHIAPGMVGNTEFSNVRLKDDAKASAVYAGIEALHPEDVAEAVLYAATAPLNVQISDVVLYANNQSGPRDLIRAGEKFGAK